MEKKNILAICGSASKNSSNLAVLQFIVAAEKDHLNLEIVDNLSKIPHFQTELTDVNVPNEIIELRSKIANSDGVIICTPEYIFSIPSGLKNMIEWCVSTTVFLDKPLGIITASANGTEGHKELIMIMKTLEAKITENTTLLIQGIKGKVNQLAEINDKSALAQLNLFLANFKTSLRNQ